MNDEEIVMEDNAGNSLQSNVKIRNSAEFQEHWNRNKPR